MNKRQDPSDRLLIQQYLEGNTSVLPLLVQRYHRVFCEQAYWVLKDKESASDIAQDSWITIIDKLHTLEHVDSFKGWASRIVYTKAIDAVKYRNKERQHVEALGMEASDHPSDQQESNLHQMAILKAIQKLPRGKQDIIRLFYHEAYSISEISEFLNIPIGTVKSRLFKAREKLKSIIKN